MKVTTKHLDIANGLEYFNYSFDVQIPIYVDVSGEDYQRIGLMIIDELNKLESKNK